MNLTVLVTKCCPFDGRENGSQKCAIAREKIKLKSYNKKKGARVKNKSQSMRFKKNLVSLNSNHAHVSHPKGFNQLYYLQLKGYSFIICS